MKRFVSLPLKILVITITALLITSIALTSISLIRLQNDFETYQKEKIRSGEEQFHQQNRVLKSQMRTWLESFSDLIKLSEQDSYDVMATALNEQYEWLQLRLDVENIWLYQENKGVIFQTDEVPGFVNKNIRLSLEFQEPQSKIYCLAQCVQLVSVPLLNGNGELGVVVMTTTLVDMVVSLKQSLNSEVAIVSLNVNQRSMIERVQLLSVSNAPEMRQVFAKLPNEIRLFDALDNGIEVFASEKHYVINFMPLAEGNNRAFYIAWISDVSSYIETNSAYKMQIVFIGFIVFLLLALFVYYITLSSSQRLLRLSDTLPLLAKKQFEQFRQAKKATGTFFSDELDVLTHSANELSLELEKLNFQVEQKTQELENIAMYDLLTGLPNRNMLNYQVKKSLAGLSLTKSGIAVLFLDLDDFKKVNDSHGHAEGDKLLIEAARRLRQCIRNIDVACRFGGDEFVVVLTYIESEEEAIEIANAVLNQFTHPIEIGSSRFYVSTSIGISITKDENANVDDLIRQADLAMYEAKDDGGGCYHIYNLNMYQRLAHRVMLESEVREALQLNQFSLSLQPQINIEDNRLHGFEALLRWHHPERGMVSPDDFIPILENSQHMIELGYWVIRHCFELMEQLIAAGYDDINIAINLSAGQFADDGLVDFLKGLVREFEIPAEKFELELTEHTLVKDMDKTLVTMETLKSLGFSFAIDDFGTGYSSLGYLKKMPVEVIKIDKSFIFGMLENQADYQIIMSTIAMVQKLGLTVIAEGVESSAQLNALKHNNCNLVQGYYYSKPVPEHELMYFVEHKFEKGLWKATLQQIG